MNRLDSEIYRNFVKRTISQIGFWDILKNKSVLITGATGMIGSFLIDMIMIKNQGGLNCNVIALGRDKKKALSRLPWFNKGTFKFIESNLIHDSISDDLKADYAIHLASTTHPISYATDPIGTIEINVLGLRNLLNFASEHKTKTLLASSVEIYGENRGDCTEFSEGYCGYIDCNTGRACYTEAKRLCEAMCQAYRSQKEVEVSIARIARVYGPTLLEDDSKALSQFIHRAISGQDVVLKSDGNQQFSYIHVADVACGILYVLLKGKDGEAYNLSDKNSNISLKGLANLVAKNCGVNVIFDLPDSTEAAGYSKATLALMNSAKANKLGWSAKIPIEEGIKETILCMRETQNASI